MDAKRTYRCPGCGKVLQPYELAATQGPNLLTCRNKRSHRPHDGGERLYGPGRGGRLVPASPAALTRWPPEERWRETVG